MSETLWADISRWQHVVTDAYPYPILAFRLDAGSGIDGNAAANWRYCQRSPQIKAAIGYAVLRPGGWPSQFARIKNFLGAKPPAKFCLMLDVEGGADFMGSMDATTQANNAAASAAAWLGDQARVLGYDNPNDGARWTHPGWLKIVTPRYGTSDPGSWAWQFYGGDARWPSPAGYPRACPPFGSGVDLNICHMPLNQVLADLGLADQEDDDVTPDDIDKIAHAVWAFRTKAMAKQAVGYLMTAGDPATLAKAIAAKLPGVTEAQVEDAVRAVFADAAK